MGSQVTDCDEVVSTIILAFTDSPDASVVASLPQQFLAPASQPGIIACCPESGVSARYSRVLCSMALGSGVPELVGAGLYAAAFSPGSVG